MQAFIFLRIVFLYIVGLNDISVCIECIRQTIKVFLVIIIFFLVKQKGIGFIIIRRIQFRTTYLD